ncbi:MAG: hypothetical protein IPH62_06740 [Ignavibacteriae bacterium]|nr:hypothetical protein [Ignavibacteriota bacterium]
MKKILFVIFLNFFVVQSLISQTISGKFTDSILGFSLKVPENWKGEKIPQGYIFVSDVDKGFVLITPHNFNSVDEIVENAKMGITENNGTYLTLTDNLEINENSVSGIFKGFLEGQAATAFAKSLLSPFGGGISVFAFVESESFSENYKIIVNQICESVNFSERVKSSLVDEWKQALYNCRLTYMNSYNSGFGGGGIQDKIMIDLCAQGYFNYYDESQVVMSTDDVSGYSAGEKNGSGNWDVVQNGEQIILKLNFSDGNVHDYVLTFEGEKTFLNGNRYFRTYKDSTVDGTQPNCL